MDREMKMDRGVLDALFANGLMGVEIPETYGGTGANFMSACLVVEELAKVDPSVSVLCDIQNTIINNMFAFHGSEALKDRYLPQLCENMVGSFCLSEFCMYVCMYVCMRSFGDR